MKHTFNFSGFLKSKFIIFFLLIFSSGLFSLSFDDVLYWTGTGSSKALFVVDWQDNAPALIWGYKWDGTATGSDMINAISDADSRLSFTGSGFVNDLVYTVNDTVQHSGLHGNPNYWSLYTADVESDSIDWSHCGGLSFTIENGKMLGCSYGISEPTTDSNNMTMVEPIPSLPEEPNFSDITYWIGEGDKQAGVVIDWNDGIQPRSMIWGYRWNGEATGQDLMTALVNADTRLTGDVDAMVSELRYDLDNNGSVDENDHNRGMTEFPSGYWSYWVKDNFENDWAYSTNGIAGRQLTNGCFDAWVFVEDWSMTVTPYPAVPAEPPTVNEPPIDFNDVQYWIGDGENQAILVVDWNDGDEPESLVWGYKWNGSDVVTGSTIINDIAETDGRFTIEANSFLSHITYTVNGDTVHTSIGGNDYWSTWTWTEDNAWTMNSGLASPISNGQAFGCSYGFTPSTTEPDNPTPVSPYTENLPPTANNDEYFIRNDIQYDFYILKNDTDDSIIDSASIEIVADPVYGTVTINNSGFISYTADSQNQGLDSLQYTVKDCNGIVSNAATVLINLYSPFCGGVDTGNDSAIANNSEEITEWANTINLERGPIDISHPELGLASFGTEDDALGFAEGNSNSVVSLGDGGIATLGFETPITNGEGPDFAVFENGFADNVLELAFVEVSSDGENFVRFPSVSLTQTEIQISNTDGLDAKSIHNLAGKYRQGFGTPFDLQELADSASVNIDSVRFVRIVDVVGSINPEYARFDSNHNIINDPFPTNFISSGFDLDGIAVLHQLENVNNDENYGVNSITNLGKAYPNPFSLSGNSRNSGITIRYSLKYDSETSIIIYNIKGQKIKTLVDKYESVGKHFIVWNGKNYRNKKVSSGIYFYRMKAGNFTSTKKMILLK